MTSGGRHYGGLLLTGVIVIDATKGRNAVKIGIAFGQDVDRGQFVFAEQIDKPTQTPAQNHHIGGREGQREFLRRRILVLAAIRVRFEGAIDQLASIEAASALLVAAC